LQTLLAEFSRQRPHYQFILFTPAWAEPLFDEIPSNVEVVRLPSVPINRSLRIVYQQTAFAMALAQHKLDVFFATATIAPLCMSTPVVLAVQFLQFYETPEVYGSWRTAYLRHFLPWSLRKAARAIIFTEFAKQDLVRYTGVAADKVAVIPHGLSPETWAASEATPAQVAAGSGFNFTGGQPYLVYVSATYGYKNHLRLIRAFAQFKRATGLPHKLLLVGAEIHVPYAALRAEAERAGIGAEVIIAGRVPIAALTYRDATAAIIPTLYETFGFPVLEAMACGCPVITSNIGSMAELAGEAAMLVDPMQENSMTAGITQLLADAPLRQQLIERGRARAAPYTWERSARQTLALLIEAACR
jgi:glycosyltransferase involved in cell wall biosynthesis